MERDGIDPLLPDCPSDFLVNLLMEIGPTIATGFGLAAIGWRELADWQACSGTDLAPWEARMLRRLSADYAAELHAAESPERPAPYVTIDQVAANRDAVEAKILRILG